MKRFFILYLLIFFPLSCFNGLSDMYDDLTMKVPICVDNTVSSSGDGRGWTNAFKTIKEAVDAAENGDEIWVAGTQHLTVTVTIDKDLSLYGGFSGRESRREQRDVNNKTEIIANANIHISISSVNWLVIDGFKFSGFVNMGVLSINSNSSVEVKNCHFSGNSISGSGGAININASTAFINDSVFTGNSAGGGGYGGAIYADGSNLTINYSSFGGESLGSGNIAPSGGAITFTGTVGDLIITNTGFNRNNASSYGGAVRVSDANIVVKNCRFYGNQAVYLGGGINLANTLSAEVINSEFNNNSTTNVIGEGGAMHATGPLTNLSIDRTRVYSNSSGNVGGGVYFSNGNYKVFNSLITDNTVPGSNFGSDVYINTNSTVASIYNCTIINATSSQLFYFTDTDGKISLYNTILFGLGFTDDDTSTSYTNIGTNLTITAGVISNNYNIGQSDFSEFVSKYYRLAPGSVLINKGGAYPYNGFTISSIDFEGNPRIVGGIIDIGCYESQ